MNSTVKTKPLIAIIIFLLITNLAMLLFLLFADRPGERKPKDHEQNGMYNSLQSDVGFSKGQLDQYQSLRSKQRDNVRPLFNDLRKAKKDFYGLLYSGNMPDSLIQHNADSIAQKQRNLDMQMFLYFKSIKDICTPDQQQKFDSTIKKVVQRMVGRQPDRKK
jgi:Spy/CpxP family protein refolding chaperone